MPSLPGSGGSPLLDRRDRSRIAGADLYVGEEARPAIKADGLHGVRDLRGGFA